MPLKDLSLEMNQSMNLRIWFLSLYITKNLSPIKQVFYFLVEYMTTHCPPHTRACGFRYIDISLVYIPEQRDCDAFYSGDYFLT